MLDSVCVFSALFPASHFGLDGLGYGSVSIGFCRDAIVRSFDSCNGSRKSKRTTAMGKTVCCALCIKG